MKTYQVCSGNTTQNINTVLSNNTGCILYTSTVNTETSRVELRLTLSQVAAQPFTYDYIENYSLKENGIVIATYQNYRTISIPAGVLTYDWYMVCLYTEEIGYKDRIEKTYTYTESDQASIPVCYVPPGCDLTLTTINTTAPTIRGGSDGSISAAFTSSSGATATFYLNGISYGVSSSPYVFTGLTSNSYQITITQSGCTDQVNDVIVSAGEFRTGDFIVSQPSEITAVENPIILNLSTAISSLSPLKSINTFTINGSISGVSINFALTYPQVYNAEFLSKGYPDRPSYFLETILKNEIGISQGSNSNTEIATSLAEAFQSDSLLPRLYYISNSGTTVTLISKDNGNQYDLTTGNTIIIGSGITLTNIQSGVVEFDGQLAADYSLYVELYTDPSLEFGGTPDLNNYKRVVELELPFNNNNQHQFDLSTTLKNFVSSPNFDFSFTGFTTSPLMDCSYYVKYGEKYPLIENTNTKKKRYKGSTSVLYCLNSSLDFNADNDMSEYLGNLITGSTTYTGVTFLNTAPNPKYIARGSKEFLYLLLNSGYPNALTLKGDIYYYNGTSTTGVTFFNISTLTGATNFGGVAVLACGYNELGLVNYENSGNTKIRKVDFAIWQTPPTGSTIKLTETRSYLLEIDEQPQKFDVIFLNTLGTYETFSFVGEVVQDQEVTRQNYTIPYNVSNRGAADLGFIYNGVYNTELTRLWTVNTGTIDADTYNYVLGLINSNKIYNYGNPNENFLTVVGQTALKSTNDAEFIIQIQFRETIFTNNVER